MESEVLKNFPTTIDGFTQRYSDPSLAWSIDVEAPPHTEYWRVNEWADCMYSDGYQWGKICEEARLAFRDVFGGDASKDNVATLFSPTGTAANRLGSTVVLDQGSGIIINEIAHALEREGGSIPAQTGSAVYVIRNEKAHISAAELDEWMTYRKKKFWITQQPRVLSITSPAEDGTLYSPKEIAAIAEVANKWDLIFHLDGARFFYSPAYFKQSFRELTTDLGVDILALGGSKNGMYKAEATVFLPNFFKKSGTLHLYKNASSSWNQFRSYLKRHGCLVGQSAGCAAQFIWAFREDFGVKLAAEVHERAMSFADELTKIPGCHLAHPVESNVVSLSIPKVLHTHLLQKYRGLKIFEDEDADRSENLIVRFMVSHASTNEQMEDTLTHLRSFRA